VVVALAAVHALDQRMSRTCAKLLLALGLLWFYFVWCELLTDWYGATPDERSTLGLFMFGPGSGLFIVAALCEFVVPLAILIWNGARSSPRAVTIVALIVVLGNLVDRVRLYVGAWTVATPTPSDHLPDVLPPLPLPGLAEIAASVGLIALSGLVLTLVLRRVSPVSHWEVKAVERLTPEVTALRTRVNVVARPG
jgi:Ni/Fe-hydrogenase subunit HybB-like protein